MYLKWLLFAAIVVNLVMKTVQQHVYLWKITHPDRAKPSYLFGTMHVPWKILFKKIPVKNIIKNVDVVVIEANTKEASVLKDYVAQRAKAKLPENIVKRIKKNFPLRQFVLLDLPADWLLVCLTSLTNQKQMNVFYATFWATLDNKIEKIGKRNRKEMRYLETADDFRIFLPNITGESMNVLLEEALDVYEKGKNTHKTHAQWYEKGELTEQKLVNPDYGLKLTEEKEAKLKIAKKEFMADVLVARNKKWILKMND